jgi:hypothetical protein
MKVFSCDLVDGKMIVDTSIVYQDVEFAESPFDLGKSSRDLFRFGEVALNGCGGAASISDRRNDSLGIGFAASIVTMIVAPAEARCFAMEAPMPLDAPVTSATLFLRVGIFIPPIIRSIRIPRVTSFC